MRLRAPDGRTATVVRVCCRVCRDKHAHRAPGTLGLVQFIDGGPTVVSAKARNVGPMGDRGRAIFRRLSGFAQLECSSCGHRPRSHRDRLEDDARAELARHGDRLYL